jgi:hypothetical protein
VVELEGVGSLPEDLISVYPNPATESLTISFESPRGGIVSLELIDALGRPMNGQVEQVIGANALITVSLEHMESGIYLLKIERDQDHVTKTIVVTRP